MKKIAAIALALSLVSTAASAVVIDVTVEGATRRINCGSAANLATSGLPTADLGACRQFFDTAAAAGGGAGTGAGAGAAGAFGVGGAGSIALAALGIALVAGFGGSNAGTTVSASNSTLN
jgi:hypothetical protein